MCKISGCVGTFFYCNDGDVCISDFCDPVTGCESEKLMGVVCDDDNDCTIND